ncbi:PP2C family protein-serine/threonine phosphatase [Microbacterium fluvii]|uniref:PP2C family protein-serine/threonine phosphatase n=1 Tax=Microbacterium fluvii TaxID=415215 RepID=A0ABW2HJL4_9MICO|nr:protein phosphatase 2C domain-containing protein [Microbacterium fluvii]MCU4673665.1 protein phosphatase 2C domain-containing protein [Microbacterium fluvii]
MSIRLRAAAVSDGGDHRPVNQDAAFAASWGAAVADGVGGGPSGDLASAALIHRLVADAGARRPDADALSERLRIANWDLRALVERDPTLRGMATTFTGLFVSDGGTLLLAHSGDSRAYRLRDGDFVRQSRDDSFVQVLVDRGLIAPEAAASHPRRNLITASFGGSEADAPTVQERSAAPGDRWLLCSDGLTDYVPEADVAALVRDAATPQRAAAALVGLALEAGTRDNVTAVVCDVIDGEPAEEAPLFAGAAAIRFREDLEYA